MNNNNSKNKSSTISSTTRNGNSTTQACAACKYRRMKCAPDCILAPYFPHDRQRQFLNAHKLFGVRNITKIIECLDPHEKDQAMRSIIFQSDMRATDPVGGCYRYIQELQTQIEYHRAELEIVLQHLAILKAQAHQSVYNNNNVGVNVVNGDDVMNAGGVDPMTLHNYHFMQPQHDHFMMMQEGNDSNSNSSGNNNNVWAMMSSLSTLSLQGQNSTNGSVGDEYDNKPLLEMASDERNIDLGFEPEEFVHHRSDEAVLFRIDNELIKAEADHCMQQAQDHDLKGAATLFTLTNSTS